MRRTQNNKMLTIILHLALMIFSFLIAATCIVQLPEEIEDFKLNKKSNYVLEYATIVSYKEFIQYTSLYYNTYYEFVNTDGSKYNGLWQTRIKTEDEAKAMIGQKVPIYVDHEMKTHRKNLENKTMNSIWIFGIFGGLSILFFIVGLISFILHLIMWKKDKLKQDT